MPYLASSDDLTGLIPRDFVIQALDDNADGAEDTGLFAVVLADAEREIHAFCRQRYVTPFAAPYPDLIVEAAQILTAFRLYVRRGRAGEQNPLAGEAGRIRKKLQAIAQGDEPLKADMLQQKAPISIISEDSRVYSNEGNVLA